MKKFLITLLFLLALAGTAFFFGWANFAVEPGSYGVISSKSHGIDPEIIQSGQFRWIWYRLIPTNAHIGVYRLDQKKFPIHFNSSLPSGDIYARFVGLNNMDFSYELEGSISFSLKPDYLIEVTTQNNLQDQADLDNYLNEIAERIQLMILNYFNDANQELLERLLSGIKDSELEQDISARFPEIKDFSLIINNAKYPDFILYRQIRLIYEEFLEKQREFVTASFGQRAESHIESLLHFSELEKYGELITKYPLLLEYLALSSSTSEEQ